MKNILYINTTPSGGGAAAVMQQLDHMMRLRGASTHILTRLSGAGRLDDALKISSRGGLLSWCCWRGQQDYHIQKSHALRKHALFQQADILHLHNLHGEYFNLWSLPLLSALKPTVWTLHDMQALTGHCAHSLDCERWLPETGCGHCPSLSSYPPIWRDTTHQLWQDKRTIYAHSSLYLVTPSVWLQRLTEKSLLKEQPLVCIPNGADTSIYRPQDRQEARRLLGLPQDAQLARLYAALDLLLYPTLADNHPLVCIESLCCGTPIAGFATGGVPEIVRDGLDGLLVPTHDGTALTKAAATLLQDADLRKKMRKEAAASAARRFNLELFAQCYEKVYEDVLRLPRSLEKSRLPLDKVSLIVKSPAFITQECAKYPYSSRQKKNKLLAYGLKGSLYIALVSLLGWPLQIIRNLRSFYFHRK